MGAWPYAGTTPFFVAISLAFLRRIVGFIRVCLDNVVLEETSLNFFCYVGKKSGEFFKSSELIKKLSFSPIP